MNAISHTLTTKKIAKQDNLSERAYANLMLIGEHSVLYGASAVVAATQQQLTATIKIRTDSQIHILSELENYSATINNLPPNKKLRFAIASIAYAIKHLKLKQGFELCYQSTIPTTIGMGSSAAVVVATIKACYRLSAIPIDNQQLWQHCKNIIIAVQGRGSGADLCASIYGGVCLFNTKQGFIRYLNSPLLSTHYWQLHYTGYKETTDNVLLKTKQFEQQSPETVKAIYQKMANLSNQFVTHFEQANPIALGETLNNYQKLMKALQVSDNTIDSMINKLQQHPTILGAKISGSGLGDCVLSLSSSNSAQTIIPEYKHYPLTL
jgi:mevalonate kinase